MNISDALGQFFDKFMKKQKIYSIVGTVSDVDVTERTCSVTPIADGSKRSGVRLQAKLNSSQGFVQIPKEGKFVVVTFLNPETGYVALCEEVDKILIDTDLVQFNCGTDGMVKIADLVTKLNNLEERLTSVSAGHQHIYNAYPAVPTVTTTDPISNPPFIPTLKAELEDTKIKH